MNIEERLDRLEKQNANLHRGLVGLLLLVLVVPLAAFVWQDKKPKVTKFDTIEANTVRAKALFATFLDLRKGDSRIVFGATDKGAFGLLEHGKRSINLSVERGRGIPSHRGGADLWVENKKGEARLTVDELGPRVQVGDALRRRRAVLGTFPVDRMGVGAINPEFSLVVFDKKGNILREVPASLVGK